MNKINPLTRSNSHRLAAVGVLGALTLAACGSDTADTDVEPVDPAPVEAEAADETTEAETTDESDEATEEEATEEEAMEEGATEDEGDAMEEASVPIVQLQFAGLPELGDASVYEGWAIIDGAPVSTGRFTVDADGMQFDDDGNEVDHFAVDATPASAFVLTLEPTVDDDPAPSEIHLLGGDVVDGTALLSIDHPTAIGTTFDAAAGSVEVVVPTAPDNGIDTAGIWFFSDGAGSLTLPELPIGWVYEGWAVFDGIPVSTGRFTDPNMADDFNGFSGDGSSPATPGEDFIRNAPEGLEFPRSAADATVVVSVEPAHDDSPAPFVLKPLIGELPAEVERLGDYPLDNTGADAIPTGVANIVAAGV
jgi:hypothetical protein